MELMEKNQVVAAHEQMDVRAFEQVNLEPGDVAQQGDVYLVCLPDSPPCATTVSRRQIADGNTQGSRHIVARGLVLDTDTATKKEALLDVIPTAEWREYQFGPLVSPVDGSVLLTHPEHGDRQYNFEGCLLVGYQRSLDADGREERARD